MVDAVQRMLQQLGTLDRPPVERWQPALSGDIAIRIAADGQWYHEGALMTRERLVKLFASILRYDSGIGYVLVTPVEKWRIVVDDAPFIVTAATMDGSDDRPVWRCVTNVGETVCIDPDHPLYLASAANARTELNAPAPEPGSKPYVGIREGISALLSRPVYYQLAEQASEHHGATGIWSGGDFFAL